MKDRMIAEIESLEQARRVEETVKTGFAEAIQEELVNWMAVEEDLAGSYQKMEASGEEAALREFAARLRRESEENLKSLAEILDKLKALDVQRAKRLDEIGKRSA